MNAEPSQPVKVLHIITRLIVGGAQENTLYTVERLNKALYQAEVLSGAQTGSEGSLIEEGRSRHIPILLLRELVRQIDPFLDLLALVKMIFFLKRNRYRIVHTHSSKAGILGRIAAKIAGVPVIVHTVHGWSFHEQMSKTKRKMYIVLERLCARFSAAMIVVTELDREKGLQAKIGKPAQYRLIRSAIPLEEFQTEAIDRAPVRRELGLPEGAPVLGTVGRFSTQKNPLAWIQVARQVHQELPGCWFLLVGDGPLRGQVEEAIAEAGLCERVVLTGIRREIAQMMAAMDVFLLTSNWEGLPRVLPQAMSMGLPVVATRVDGSQEMIEDQATGYLCNPGDIAGLSEACLRLLKNPDLRKKIGCRGKQRANQEFDLKTMIAQIEMLYGELLNRQTASSG